MTATDLRDVCRERITVVGIDAYIQLKLPGRWRSNGKRLGGRTGPVGRVIGELDKKNVLVDFKARQVLSWLGDFEWLEEQLSVVPFDGEPEKGPHDGK